MGAEGFDGLEAFADQGVADAAALVGGEDAEGAEQEERAVVAGDFGWGESDVADDGGAVGGDERDGEGAIVAEGVDDAVFGLAAVGMAGEGGEMDGLDGGAVARGFDADGHWGGSFRQGSIWGAAWGIA